MSGLSPGLHCARVHAFPLFHKVPPALVHAHGVHIMILGNTVALPE